MKDDDWNLGYIPLSRSANVHTSVRVDFTASQSRFNELSLVVPNKASDVLGLALRSLDAWQALAEASNRVAAPKASEAERLAKIETLGSHERKPLDENRRLEHQLVTLSVERDRHGAQGVESTNLITNANVELAEVEEALRGLKDRAFADMLAMRGATEDFDHVQSNLATRLARLQGAKGALTAISDHLE